MRTQGRTVEQELAALGTIAHGVATRRQLLEAGISRSAIRRRVEDGSLIPQYRGVYRVGHCAPSVDARYMAAVMACGDGAALGGRPAGHLLGLLKGKPPKPEVITSTERRIEGISTRRVRRLDRRDVTVVRGIRVTSVARTLVDLAAILSIHELAQACHEAGVRYKTTPRQVEAALNRYPNAPGRRNLRAIMRGDAAVTLSKLERAFLRLLRQAGLPLPVTNRVAGGRRVDCRWSDSQVTVELDSYRFHNSRYAWERDRQRERAARAREDRFERYTWADVVERPAATERDLRRLLTRGRPA
jgi:hypothetical protein